MVRSVGRVSTGIVVLAAEKSGNARGSSCILAAVRKEGHTVVAEPMLGKSIAVPTATRPASRASMLSQPAWFQRHTVSTIGRGSRAPAGLGCFIIYGRAN